MAASEQRMQMFQCFRKGVVLSKEKLVVRVRVLYPCPLREMRVRTLEWHPRRGRRLRLLSLYVGTSCIIANEWTYLLE